MRFVKIAVMTIEDLRKLLVNGESTETAARLRGPQNWGRALI